MGPDGDARRWPAASISLESVDLFEWSKASPQSVFLAPLQGRNGNEILGKPRAPRFAFFGLVGPLHSISWGHLAIAAWRIIILPPVPETMPGSGRQPP